MHASLTDDVLLAGFNAHSPSVNTGNVFYAAQATNSSRPYAPVVELSLHSEFGAPLALDSALDVVQFDIAGQDSAALRRLLPVLVRATVSLLSALNLPLR